MEAQPVNRSVFRDHSFMLKNQCYDNFLKVWHCHPEAELVVVLESTGTRFVGDSIEKFEAGEIVLIGENLPHLWLNDKDYFSGDSSLKARAYVAHFQKDLARKLSAIPELSTVSNLFSRARRGIKFEMKSNPEITKGIASIFGLEGHERMIKMLNVLRQLSEQPDYRLLSSSGYVQSFQKKKEGKILAVYEYVMNNFTGDISLEDAAGRANMNSSSFSRYFKRINKKTFSKFINEVRIGYACKLLIEQKYNISEVCYRSGFNNVSNFNRQFKSLKKMTPSQYIAHHIRQVEF